MVEKNVLFVDDEEPILKSVKRLFRNQGCKIYTAVSAQEGLNVMENEHIHLVVSDHRMPGMSGAEFLAQVRHRWPHITRIIMTGYADISSVIDGINKAQIRRFIVKPWDVEELKEVIKKELSLTPDSTEHSCLNEEHCLELQRVIAEQRAMIKQLSDELDRYK